MSESSGVMGIKGSCVFDGRFPHKLATSFVGLEQRFNLLAEPLIGATGTVKVGSPLSGCRLFDDSVEDAFRTHGSSLGWGYPIMRNKVVLFPQNSERFPHFKQ